MHFLNNGSQVETVPSTKSRIGAPGYFSESNEDNTPSYPGQDWFNAVIREFQTALTRYGVPFDPDNFDHLSQLIQLTALPIGTPLPWMTDSAPEGWAIMKGQAFDTDLYPQTAAIYPDGTLPDMRGRGLIGKEDGEIVGEFAEGQVKSHGHAGSTISSTNLGTKYTSTNGNHRHYTRGGYQGGYTSSYHNADAAGGSHGNVLYGNTTGNHNHSVAIGTHSHSVTIATFGASKNTIDHLKCNWIVRLA
ncbi:phage tail protein [Grimontia sp. NTOU-MAR1]|uniref:phage tail protein n=1 Tax=Grimontia sp. NTOU-MAR1 TaxID=3111011 RepID=UPI002DB94619|nr:phage tail protein [Grimontia sp. NTOU-MAR1]WRV98584.1 phage tail protein [Grimontia sp. NTOU-MAR1]